MRERKTAHRRQETVVSRQKEEERTKDSRRSAVIYKEYWNDGRMQEKKTAHRRQETVEGKKYKREFNRNDTFIFALRFFNSVFSVITFSCCASYFFLGVSF